jgi:hypothetical protein
VQGLAFVFRPIPSPRTVHALLASVVCCTLLQLSVGAPYAANERAANPKLHTAVRGLIVGALASFVIGPIFLVNSPTIVRGGFHPRYLLAIPSTLGVGVGVACIPVDGSTLGIGSAFFVTIALSFVLGIVCLNGPLFATDEHKALDQSFGPPLFGVALLFSGLVVSYVALTRLYSTSVMGLLLPVGSTATRVVALFVSACSFHKYYFLPKATFLAQQQAANSADGQVGIVPPLLGDVERCFGNTAAFFALLIGNGADVATIVGSVLAPDSNAWVVALASSSLQQALHRVGLTQRLELWLAGRLSACFGGLTWPVRMGQTSALKLVYLHSLGAMAYVSPMMAVCIGCLRALSFGDARCVVWLDVSPSVPWVLLAQFVGALLIDTVVWAVAKKGYVHFAMSERFVPDHPLRNATRRDFDVGGYAFVLGAGGCGVYLVFLVFLGPAFVTGACPGFAANSSDSAWVASALLHCVNATAIVANKTAINASL